MNRRAKYSPLLAALTLILAAPLLKAESLDLDILTAEAPAGWTANPAEGAYVIFDPTETVSLIVNYTKYYQPDFSVMARRLAIDNAVKELGDFSKYFQPDSQDTAGRLAIDNVFKDLGNFSGFIFFEDRDYRFWRGVTLAGQSMEISVHGTHENLPDLLKNIRVSAETKDIGTRSQFQVLLNCLRNPEVIAWLTGAAPLFADPPRPRPEPIPAGEPEATKLWQGLGLTGLAPQSWTISTENDQTKFSSADQKEHLIIIPLPSLKVADFGDDFDRYQARCVEEVARIGGVNLRAAEGTIYFDMPNLSEGEIFNADNHSFILIRQGGSPELEALHWSLLE